MSDSEFNLWDNIIGGALSLQGDAFRQIASLDTGIWLALTVVLLAGLSLGIGQSIILFINRVQPRRFLFSLILNAILFTFGFIFLALSTWLICLLPWSVHVPLVTLIKVLALGYAPLLLSFLVALPYLGYSLNIILAAWNLLAIVVGFAVIARVGADLAFGYVVFGWLVKQLLEQTIGQPIASFGRTLTNLASGVEFTRSSSELRELVSSGIRPANPILPASSSTTLPEVRQFFQSSRSSLAPTQTPSSRDRSLSRTSYLSQTTTTDDPMTQMDYQIHQVAQPLQLLLGLMVMVGVFLLVMFLLDPVRNWSFSWHQNLSGLTQLIFDLVWIGVVAIVFAGILAPLESLGWWAGWYGDDLDTESVTVVQESESASSISRYLVYLDGIGQSGQEYTPDVEDFLTALRSELPPDLCLVQGLMMYSVLNKPLGEDRPLAFLWKLADRMRWQNPTALLGILVNLRNVLIVAVSSDKRYGPIYNQGIAQVIFDGLKQRGYQPGSGIPITLIGYSGGGEMSLACAPYLKRSTGAAINVISLGGVMSANNNCLKLEHLYHIVGEKDSVEKLGPIMFPGRWKIFPLSYWNRAKRKGKITILDAGPVGHQVPGGYMDPLATLPDGASHLDQTIEIILQILEGKILRWENSIIRKPSNYSLYQELAFNRPDYYPLHQTIDLEWYQPLGNWLGRLILPSLEERGKVKGVWFEVHHAPSQYRYLLGQRIKLRWSSDPRVQKLVQAVTKDIHFSADAEFSGKYGGLVHPDRLNHWQQVDPLESLAGGRPVDDLIVKLKDPVELVEDILYIKSTPVQVTGRYYALVQFLAPVADTDQFRVIHFHRASRQFDGKEELMRLPPVRLAEAYGSYPSTTKNLTNSPFNQTGWYVYGARDHQGMFVVQSLAPRALFQVQPERVIWGTKASYQYVRRETWKDIKQQKGKISSVLCCSDAYSSSLGVQGAINQWQLGDQALVVHTYGGIGGNKKEPAAATPIFFGHFAYGIAEVIQDPLTAELRFDICYHQVYTHNTDGLIAGTLHWSRYLGDRQFGWLGSRPTCDILIKLDAFTKPYQIEGITISPLHLMMRQLQVMTARYRIGDGTGGTYVGPANNCSQDSNQALFSSFAQAGLTLKTHPEVLQSLRTDPHQSRRFNALGTLAKDLKRDLQPFGGPRPDWQSNEYNLGSTLEDNPLRNLWTGLGSWRTILPRLASDTIVKSFLDQGATVWVLRTNQVGGWDPDIEPIAPITL